MILGTSYYFSYIDCVSYVRPEIIRERRQINAPYHRTYTSANVRKNVLTFHLKIALLLAADKLERKRSSWS